MRWICGRVASGSQTRICDPPVRAPANRRGATPAIVNAIVDALAPFGVKHLDMPVKPENVWRIINGH